MSVDTPELLQNHFTQGKSKQVPKATMKGSTDLGATVSLALIHWKSNENLQVLFKFVTSPKSHWNFWISGYFSSVKFWGKVKKQKIANRTVCFLNQPYLIQVSCLADTLTREEKQTKLDGPLPPDLSELGSKECYGWVGPKF